MAPVIHHVHAVAVFQEIVGDLPIFMDAAGKAMDDDHMALGIFCPVAFIIQLCAAGFQEACLLSLFQIGQHGMLHLVRKVLFVDEEVRYRHIQVQSNAVFRKCFSFSWIEYIAQTCRQGERKPQQHFSGWQFQGHPSLQILVSSIFYSISYS